MELSEFKANEGKQVNIQVGDRTFARHAIATHFVQVGESYMDLIQKYVVPIYQEGDILSSSEKIISLCQKRIVRKSDMKLSWLAKFLSKFASHSSAGIGVDSPWKMQFAIDQRGALYVIWAGHLRRLWQALRQAGGVLRDGRAGGGRAGRLLRPLL